MTSVPVIMNDLRSIAANAARVDTALRATLGGRDSTPAIAAIPRLIAELNQVVARFADGSLALLANDTLLSRRLVALAAGSVALRSQYSSPNLAGAAERFEYVFVTQIDSLAERFNSVARAFEARATEYTSGNRAAALSGEISRLVSSLQALRADMRRRPLRYLIF
jgi:hypothetical protein